MKQSALRGSFQSKEARAFCIFHEALFLIVLIIVCACDTVSIWFSNTSYADALKWHSENALAFHICMHDSSRSLNSLHSRVDWFETLFETYREVAIMSAIDDTM
jgi:hypothetical protein